MQDSTDPDVIARIARLTNRLNTLRDVAEARRGSEVTFAEIADFLATRGVTLSRARWSYMINGHRLVDDPDLLDGLSAFFDTPSSYLRGDAELPEKLAAELDLVRAMRVARVRSYAARTLGDLSPNALQAITRFLDEEEAARAGGTQNT